MSENTETETEVADTDAQPQGELIAENSASGPDSGQGEMPFAIVEGQPMTQLPLDLYIPPDALEVFLDAFEGPLDLLLYLIKRQNLDILDIPIAEITRQYMGYIALLHELQFELAAEYLLMAAMLAEIKSRMLLPRSGEVDEDEEDITMEIPTMQNFNTTSIPLVEVQSQPKQKFSPAKIPAPKPPAAKAAPIPGTSFVCQFEYEPMGDTEVQASVGDICVAPVGADLTGEWGYVVNRRTNKKGFIAASFLAPK